MMKEIPELKKLKNISIQEIDLSKVIISKCGEHNRDKLIESIEKKLCDIENVGYCFWAHGNLDPSHTRGFCEGQEDIYVLMPITISNSTGQSPKYKFTKWKDENNEKHAIPSEMNDVTGGEGSNRAFCFEKLYFLKEKCDLKGMLSHYLAINKASENEASETLKFQCSNKCIKIKDNTSVETVKKCFGQNGDTMMLIGKLRKPYHVELCDKILIRQPQEG